MKQIIIAILFTILGVMLVWIVFEPKIAPYYVQLTKTRVGLSADLQPKEQKTSHFVGSKTCGKCHEENYRDWKHSMHSRMIQDIRKDPGVVVADFSKLPEDADFTLKEAVYTIGSKFKQRYMIPAKIDGKEDFRLGNYQWNVQTGKWQRFKPWKYWYHDAYPHDNRRFPTSNTCDGCHFTGYMSTGKRVELAIACESCHGPGSKHAKTPESPIYRASMYDPIRTNEVCLQCHMRNRDNRLKTNPDIKSLWMKAKDYPDGYEPGRSLIAFKMAAPFVPGNETKEFWPNGAAKKNRTQGNEFVRDAMYQHGITCINCHDPHRLSNTAKKPEGNRSCMKCHGFNSLIGPHQATLEEHTHHKADSNGSRCIECHMPKTGRHTGKSPLTVRSHMFRFVTPAETEAYGMPPETNACYHCHKEKSLEELQSVIDKWGEDQWVSQEAISHYILNRVDK
ncbi:multiheme c-type cytochrome [Hydrogenimonas urashimensis]|uniref:multiheme c-type cytochrome n=1 Tax=Hydrogenimonas urashimensis TaxID=2740515 RepID=UPI0019153097|nr:multiheme c-type cytochrome [Hydrogenimonas urashimensis]